MDQTTTSTQASSGSTDMAGSPGAAHRTRRRAFLAVGAAAILAAGTGAGALAIKSGSFASKAKPVKSAFTGATDTITKGDLQGQTSVTGTLRYSDSRKFKSGFEGVLIQLPTSGTVLTQGDVLYRTGTETAHLMHGALPAWRAFEIGMDKGEDVRQLQEALKAMGYLEAEADGNFGWATSNAVARWQKDAGLPRTGTITLGQVVFAPGDLRVGSLTARVGDRVAADTELYDVTSTTQVVDANVKLSDQRLAVVGTAVTIKLPDTSTTTGKITSVGTPTEKSSGSGDSKERFIPVTITLDDASATANFQEVSVTVDLPSEKREGVLSVPVGALLALTPDQYGIEIVESGGTTRKVPVTIGLFAGGRVEISGEGISEGQRVVVPQS